MFPSSRKRGSAIRLNSNRIGLVRAGQSLRSADSCRRRPAFRQGKHPGAATFNLHGCEIYNLNGTPDSHFIYTDLLIAAGETITLANGATPGFTPTYAYPPSNIALANASNTSLASRAGSRGSLRLVYFMGEAPAQT